MVAFAFQNPNPNPIPAPGGAWRASVVVSACPDQLGGYTWRSRLPFPTEREALRAALAHLKTCALLEMHGACPCELERHLSRIKANRWD